MVHIGGAAVHEEGDAKGPGKRSHYWDATCLFPFSSCVLSYVVSSWVLSVLYVFVN